MRRSRTATALLVLAVPVGVVVWRWFAEAPGAAAGVERRLPAVATAPIERGAIEELRTFSGTLVADAQFVVAPKVGGRLAAVLVDVGDAVAPGAVVAELDDDEFVQAVAEAEAALAVARAAVTLARSRSDIAQNEYERVVELRDRGIVSGAGLDTAEAEQRARSAEVQVAEAEVQRAEASLRAQQVRLGYTRIAASWSGDDTPRVVAARHVDAGANVAINAPIVTVVDSAVLRAVLFATERDYARLAIGQPAAVTTDAWPGETFRGRVERLAPVFETASRQARVEVRIDNTDRRLKPGMFVRVGIVLATADDATIVPADALVRREAGLGVFEVAADPAGDGHRVRFVPVREGIRDGDRVQVLGAGLAGRVVTLGQQLIDDGAAVRVADHEDGTAPPARR